MGGVFTTPTPILAGGMYVDVGLSSPENIGLFVFLLTALLYMVVTEALELHTPYSKFSKPDAIAELPVKSIQKLYNARFPSRPGFFILYVVPLISYVIMWAIYAAQNMQAFGQVAPSPGYSIILLIGWCLSFGKRCFEVLFIHVYSGDIPVVSSLLIAFAYSAAGLCILAFSNQVVGYVPFSPQTIVKDVICFICYFIGISVNFMAHYQLRQSRMKKSKRDSEAVIAGTKEYLSPAEIGILFKIFICPHYFFETMLFVAYGVFGATSLHYMMSIAIMGYLGLRTRATYRWYVKKGLIKGRSSNQKTSLLSSAARVGDA